MGPSSGTTRAALDRGAPIVLAILHDNLNKLVRAANQAHADQKLGLEGDLRDVLNRGGFRYLELTLGKKMQFNVNLRTQDDLVNLRAMPPAMRAEVDRALDAIEAFEQGRTIDATARVLEP